jgi:hypothetical protein
MAEASGAVWNGRKGCGGIRFAFAARFPLSRNLARPRGRLAGSSLSRWIPSCVTRERGSSGRETPPIRSAAWWPVAGADLLWEKNIADWLVTGGWCWTGVREKHCWLEPASRTRPRFVLVFPLRSLAEKYGRSGAYAQGFLVDKIFSKMQL